MEKKKVVVFTGAGVSAESGIATFRTGDDGLWMNYKIENVATPEGWKEDRDLVNQFYNERRAELEIAEPNNAHKLLAELEKDFDVTIITQNVDDLHERGGSTNVIHLHGELTKVRSTANEHEILDWGYKPLGDSDRGKNNARLRPHIVWFGEWPFRTNEAYDAIVSADIMIVIGTSFNIGYTPALVNSCPNNIPVYFIDPKPTFNIFSNESRVNYINKPASKGMEIITSILNK